MFCVAGNATEVLFHVTVMSLDTIDESSMTYTCDIFFAQSWHDYRSVTAITLLVLKLMQKLMSVM